VNLFQLGTATLTQAETVWASLDIQLVQRVEHLVKVVKAISQLQAVSLFITEQTNSKFASVIQLLGAISISNRTIRSTSTIT